MFNERWSRHQFSFFWKFGHVPGHSPVVDFEADQ
jgi:hypothetical protein